ncbi:McrC family protein [Rhizobium hidalgonense]|uniref:McrC family protein n=1 Tax=Rhizobium hidalgonense TaxID=1538159 RepID=UPI002871592A|nr:McrC family protein [Rhizobium hidalgonense]MDR9809680.1 McrC family protein [Rhizobium hidalgonense]
MLTVREFARLTTDEVAGSMDLATIPTSAFEWLARHGRDRGGAPSLVKLEGPRTLKLRNYVGVVETPCGTRIEILPKHIGSTEGVAQARRLLIKMVSEALNLTPRIAGGATIDAFDLPMTEWLAASFLAKALELARRGPRQAYRLVEAREPFLRGRLDFNRQLRAAAGGAHMFHVTHDVYSLDRPENRLIRSAIEHIARRSVTSDNWRLARELSILFADVPESRNINADLKCWGRDRHLADYADIKPLCELLLTHRLPFALAGDYHGMSMLFPMERLFERYVLGSLRMIAPEHFEIHPQHGAMHLCSQEGQDWFQMKPDILVASGAQRWIIDAKWKRLSTDRDKNYELSQADFYQLFAYGQKYLAGTGEMYLVYPAVSDFPTMRAPFKLSDDLLLHVLPFDLERRQAPYTFLAG